MGSRKQVSAAEGFSLRRQTSTFPGQLIVEGFEINTITKVFDLMENEPDILVITQEAAEGFYLKDTGHILVSRTLTAGRSWYGSLDDNDSVRLADFCAYLASLPKDHILTRRGWRNIDWGEGLSKYAATERTPYELAQKGDENRLFLTADGLLGLGPTSMNEGDVLCVLSGGDLPFILRPKDGHFGLVGECYVEKLINGEAVKAAMQQRALEGDFKGISLKLLFREKRTLEKEWFDLR